MPIKKIGVILLGKTQFNDFVQRRLGMGFCLDGSYTFSPAKN